jgi:hypothetical protein
MYDNRVISTSSVSETANTSSPKLYLLLYIITTYHQLLFRPHVATCHQPRRSLSVSATHDLPHCNAFCRRFVLFQLFFLDRAGGSRAIFYFFPAFQNKNRMGKDYIQHLRGKTARFNDHHMHDSCFTRHVRIVLYPYFMYHNAQRRVTSLSSGVE